MSKNKPTDGPLSLADVLQIIEASQELSDDQRAGLRSAVKRTADLVAGGNLHTPADPNALAVRLDLLTPAMAGLSKGSFANLKSRLRKALKLAGIVEVPGRHVTGLTPAWQALMDSLSNGRIRRGLSRFAHFASERDWEPSQISDRHLLEFKNSLETRALVSKPRKIARNTARWWNDAAKIVPTWPQVKLTPPTGRERYAIPWTDFPTSLQEELAAYLKWLESPDPLTEPDRRPLAPSSITNREFALRQAASALVHSGTPIAEVTNFQVLTELSNVRTALTFFLERASATRNCQASFIALFLYLLARDWVKRPETEVREIYGYFKKIHPQQQGLTEKNKRRLRQFDDPANVRRFFDLPQVLLQEAERYDEGNLRGARLAMAALMVDLLTYAPIRAANLAGLDIEKHLWHSGSGRKGQTHLVIPGEEVKNGQALEFVLSASTRNLLSKYIDLYRPALVKTSCSCLFPRRDGSPISTAAVLALIKSIGRRYAGLELTPHLFRHITSKLFLQDNPGGYETVRRTLGHKTINTTTAYYTGLETAADIRHFDQTILNIRERLLGGRSRGTEPDRSEP